MARTFKGARTLSKRLCVVILLLTRQTRAATANALQEIAEARKASVAAAPQK